MRRTWRWVTRADASTAIAVWSSTKKPKGCFGYWTQDNGSMTYLCAKGFEKLTGIRIAPGSCQRVEFTARVIEE